MRLPNIVCLYSALCFIVGCRVDAAPPLGKTIHAPPTKLPSQGGASREVAQAVRVLDKGMVHFRDGPPALVIRYETIADLRDLNRLSVEADSIWRTVEAEIKQTTIERVVLSATAPATKIYTRSAGYNFVYMRAVDGDWVRRR